MKPERILQLRNSDNPQKNTLVECLDEIERLRLIMEAVASMAGKHWIFCQLALGEALNGTGGENYNWVMEQYKQLKEQEGG